MQDPNSNNPPPDAAAHPPAPAGPSARLLGLLHHTVLCAVDNKKHRAFLPRAENYFGGIRVARVMIDTGCNSHLLGVAGPDAVGEIYARLPPATHNYEVGVSQGVAALSSLTLVVVGKKKEPIEWRLCADIHPVILARHPYLRFSLSVEDAIRLKADHDREFLTVENAELLGEFVQNADALRLVRPDAVLAPRRLHSLLGRDVMDKVGNFMVAREGLVMIGFPEDLREIGALEMKDRLARRIEVECREYARAHLGSEDASFDDLEDEYAADIPVMDEPLWDDDYRC